MRYSSNYYQRSNYILHLNKPYEELYKAYRENHKRNITKAMQLGCSVSKEIPVDEIIQLNEEQLKHIDGTKPEDYPNFKKLYELLKRKDKQKLMVLLIQKIRFLPQQFSFSLITGLII